LDIAASTGSLFSLSQLTALLTRIIKYARSGKTDIDFLYTRHPTTKGEGM
jgi:hypothetical protein